MDTRRFRFLAVAVLCSLMLVGALSVVVADVSPPGCNTNNLVMSLTRTPTIDHNGDTVNYTVVVSNLATGVPGLDTCDVTGVVVTFNPPAADGSPTGTTQILDPGSDFPVGTVKVYGPIPVVLALNANVTAATAASHFAGVLHDAPNNDAVSGDKTVTVLVVHPCISVTKTPTPPTSKAGDDVSYHICVTNCSDDDDTLNNISVIDSLVGDISGMFPASIAVGQTACADVTYTVQPGDPDPLVNTVTASGSDSAATPETVSFTTTATVDLIHPSIDITKVANPTTSIVGGLIDYTITITNTGDSALKNIVVTDDLLGPVGAFVTDLAIGGSDTVIVSRTVQPGDPDPLVNTATVHANPDVPGVDFTNDITDSATATVDLQQPGISITKVANPTTSKAGDTVDYEICVTNTGTDTLVNITVTDTVLGDLSGSFADTLGPGASECETFSYDVQPGDPDPLVNVVTVHANPEGFATDITDTATATVDLVHPSFTISKACSPDPVAVGGTLTWTITLVNTGDISLDIHVVDPTAGIDETDTVADGATHTITATHVVVVGDTSPIANEATATATLTGDILPNVIGPQSASSSCAIQTGGPTRTPGYWFTHPTALLAAFHCLTGSNSGTLTLCAGSCTATANDAMAIFWNTDGSNRPTLAQQILAAMFNQCVFGTTAPDSIIQNGLDVLCDPNATSDEIGAVIGPLDAFNMSGDNLPFPPGINFGNANPKTAKSMANAGTVPDCAAGKK